MKEREQKFRDIVEKIKKENPTVSNGELSKLIGGAIKMSLPKPEPLLPMNATKEITGAVRAQAENVSMREKGLIVQFVRPGKPKLTGAKVNLEAGTINKIYSKKLPVGALVAFRDGADVLIGWSKYNQAHEVVAFTKKEATLIAIMRALTDGIKPGPEGCYVTDSDVVIPKVINKAIEPFATRASTYFKGILVNVNFV